VIVEEDEDAPYELVIVAADLGSIRPVVLDPARDLVTIGRGEACDVVLASSSVSRRHARLELRAGEWWIRDLSSANGTWVDGVQLVPDEPRRGRALRFGDVSVTLSRPMQKVPERLERRFDGLTQLPTGPAIEELLQQARAVGAPLALVVLDLDRFKRLNDTHGHPAGDAVLGDVVARVRAHLTPGDVLAREGSDTFVIGLPGVDLAAAVARAEAIRLVISGAPFRHHSATMATTASCGVALCEAHERGTHDARARADHRLGAAKAAGRDRVAW
jgi:diguanylate cyclase (GGDEF)-like protein